jgi:hypothetical protein
VSNPRRLFFCLGPAHKLHGQLGELDKLEQLHSGEVSLRPYNRHLLTERLRRAAPRPPLQGRKFAIDCRETEGRFVDEVVGQDAVFTALPLLTRKGELFRSEQPKRQTPFIIVARSPLPRGRGSLVHLLENFHGLNCRRKRHTHFPRAVT